VHRSNAERIKRFITSIEAEISANRVHGRPLDPLTTHRAGSHTRPRKVEKIGKIFRVRVREMEKEL
jgi:hypothetical protein